MVSGQGSEVSAFVGSLYEVSSGGRNANKEHVFLGGTRVATVTNPSTGSGQAGEVHYYHHDHLGGTNVLTDSDGAVKQVLEYEPYGRDIEVANDLSPEAQAHNTFTSHYKDAETGLIFMQARYYDPGLGRFITADTIVQNPGNSVTFNRYHYAGNNPVNNIDPDGHGWASAFKSFVSGFVGALAGALVFPILGPVGAGIVAGAVSGAISGGWTDQGWSWQGAGMGALVGGAIGGVGGAAVGQWGVKAGLTLLAAGAIYSGVTGGWEGLGDFAAGAVGGIAGAVTGNAFLETQPVSTADRLAYQLNNDGNLVSDDIASDFAKSIMDINSDRTVYNVISKSEFVYKTLNGPTSRDWWRVFGKTFIDGVSSTALQFGGTAVTNSGLVLSSGIEFSLDGLNWYHYAGGGGGTPSVSLLIKPNGISEAGNKLVYSIKAGSGFGGQFSGSLNNNSANGSLNFGFIKGANASAGVKTTYSILKFD